MKKKKKKKKKEGRQSKTETDTETHSPIVAHVFCTGHCRLPAQIPEIWLFKNKQHRPSFQESLKRIQISCKI